MISSKPNISVIIRTINRSEVLSRSINCVLGQSRKDLELIIVDDCSTDNTATVISNYSKEDDRIVPIIRKINSRKVNPQEEPMNDALSIAKGKYIAYLDDDNQWSKYYLERMVGFLEKNPSCVLVYCDTLDHIPENDLIWKINRDNRPFIRLAKDMLLFPHTGKFKRLEFFSNGKGYKDYVDVSEIVNRKDALDSIGGKWAIAHPNKKRIDCVQAKFGGGRHNDIYLVELMIKKFGQKRVGYLPELLSHYIFKTHPQFNNPKADFTKIIY